MWEIIFDTPSLLVGVCIVFVLVACAVTAAIHGELNARMYERIDREMSEKASKLAKQHDGRL